MQKEELGDNQNNNKDRAERRETNAAMGTWYLRNICPTCSKKLPIKEIPPPPQPIASSDSALLWEVFPDIQPKPPLLQFKSITPLLPYSACKEKIVTLLIATNLLHIWRLLFWLFSTVYSNFLDFSLQLYFLSLWLLTLFSSRLSLLWSSLSCSATEQTQYLLSEALSNAKQSLAYRHNIWTIWIIQTWN